ncbi:MAG: glucosyltransferase domain-containing protein [Eubacterium sp.]
MESCKSKFFRIFENNKKQLAFCIIVTFVWGMVTHAYMFFGSYFSHDSIVEFNADLVGTMNKLEAGRIFVPIYRALIRSDITLPWMIGLLGLVYIGLSLFLIVKIFNVKSKILTILFSGVLVTNVTVIATIATYIQDFDSNMLALLFAVVAVYIWNKYDKGFLIGFIFAGLSLGFYQSYISVAITLIMMVLIFELLKSETFSNVLKKGLKSVVMLLLSGVFYIVCIKVSQIITNTTLSSGETNSLTGITSISAVQYINNILQTYVISTYKIIFAFSSYSEIPVAIFRCVIIFIAGILLLINIYKNKMKIKETVLLLCIILLMPVGMNVASVLTNCFVHELMFYALWFVYIFALLILYNTAHNSNLKIAKYNIVKCSKITVSILVIILLWSNVQSANTVYLKKDLENDANLSMFTRIVYDIENTENYVIGETNVVFVGVPEREIKDIEGFSRYTDIIGAGNTYVLGAAGRNYYVSYFENILANPTVIADENTWEKMQNDNIVKEMPCYPDEGSIQMIDGILVVKLGEPKEQVKI